MFEEDFERCFICQQPCRGLYCSSECRLQDKGTPSPAVRAKPTPVRLTAQLPLALSPLVRPTHHIAPSPVMPAHVPNGDSSSSSSMTSSPLQSPRTNPSASDSPQKDVFNLPPPAFPAQAIGFPGSVPVKIPALARAPIPQPIPSHGSTVYPTGASIDTLRFGRRPGLTNSVTSPNALCPRCACGKPANHRNRPSSRERDLESGFSALALGPPRVKPLDDRTNRLHENRMVSDSAIPPINNRRPSSSHLKSGHGTPALNIEPRYQTISSVIGGGSLLSRSRSDPIPTSPKSRSGVPQPQMAPTKAVITPSSRRASAGHTNDRSHIRFEMPSPTGAPSSFIQSTILPPLALPLTQGSSDRRGRSRERHEHPDSSGFSGVLGDRSRSGSKRRTDGPSRSRHRRDERERERRRSEQPLPEVQQLIQEHATITPSWSRRPAGQAVNGFGEGVAPAARRGAGSGEISPTGSGDGNRSLSDDGEKQRRAEEIRKANKTLGQMFGVAAG